MRLGFDKPQSQDTQATPNNPRVANSGTSVTEKTASSPEAGQDSDPYDRDDVVSQKLYNYIFEIIRSKINLEQLEKIQYADLISQLNKTIAEIASEKNLPLNEAEQNRLALSFADDMKGNGPLDPFLKDDSITDIMVNGRDKIYVEQRGRMVLTGEQFRDDTHLRNVAQNIATNVGRRVDEANPMVDARLPDGSRVNIVFPPLAVDGACISIRRFSAREITLDMMARQGNLDDRMARFLALCGKARMNTVVSGGTGSGKTTMLNALSRHIGDKERVLTIEDSCELRLQQPHIVRLETRPSGSEGGAAITQRDLVKNALRMRPDRIILGEVREGECFDMLQAMNTGHEGSMATLHANTPRDALMRMENMVMMAGFELPIKAIRANIASSLDLIVQVERMRDGVRRVTKITEVIGMEGDIIATQDIFAWEHSEFGDETNVTGAHRCINTRPRIIDRMRRYGLADRANDIFRTN